MNLYEIARGRFHTAKSDRWVIIKLAEAKKIVLFGAGKRAEQFLEFHMQLLPLHAIVDNDIAKQGCPLTDVIDVVKNSVNKNLKIQSVEYLNDLDDDEVFVVIANDKPEPLIEQLKAIGKTHFVTFDQWEECQIRLPLGQKIDDNKIVFIMYMHGAHEKAITKQLLFNSRKLNMVWILDRIREDVPDTVKVVLIEDLFDCYYEACSAKIWVTGIELLDECFKKRDEQICVQVKHWSSLTLKTFGKEANKNIISREAYKNTLTVYKNNASKIDYVLTGSDFDEETCRKGWGYEGKCVRIGSPRTDIIFDQSGGSSVYERIGIDKSFHLAMYAPTFRTPPNCSDPLHGLNFETLHKALTKRFGGEWKILLRLHPLVSSQAKHLDLPPYVINASDYDDSEELADASDITVTDYSSIMFEPAFAYKPVFLYAPDKDEYQREHPLLLEYDELPFPISHNNEELISNVRNFNKSEYVKKLEAFFTKYGVHEDGHASERAARFILDLLDGKVHEGAPRDNLDYKIERG